ncbi:xanthine dehydrogenase family protein molybdopterin-binding subunit [Pseudooceanicola sp. C21-150M6]|uniref:xanthine dehydrogenase family protein molybdopterin-binding subunit n=1 Tax=Pseudooceanicola sp. C21-150M6 TaxID=3434355 RepID=UPI003D7FA54C
MPDTLYETGHVRLGSNAGQPMTRRDGIAKVTGTATYAADNRPEGLLHAVIATASIARGRVTALDTAAALAHPGVVHVMTPENRPPLSLDPDGKAYPFGFRTEALQSDTVRYAGQPIALVVAETVEAATEGARLLNPRYSMDPARVDFDTIPPEKAETVGMGMEPVFTKGDVDTALRDAAETSETHVATPPQYHNAMEPHAMVAQWDGDRLTLDSPNQALVMASRTYAAFFGLPEENVTLRSPYLGGGFGSKAIVLGPYLMAILAARDLGRPVKLTFRRDQMYGPTGHRGATRQKLTIGTDAQGHIQAIDHHATAVSSSFDVFSEPAARASLNTYAAPALRSSHDLVRMDVGTPGPMRAPGEASGSAALEIAMDVAAEKAGIDPLEFRLRNYAEVDPASGKPFSAKSLRECYAEGAKRFGWEGRPLAPRSMSDEQGMLIGWGMGTALFPAPMFAASARAVLRADGSALVETSGADMGQGAWTALAQIAADGLGLPIDRVEFRSGNSTLPDAGVAGGSGHTASAGSALFAAGGDAIRQLAELAENDPDSPLFGSGNAGFEARDGYLVSRADESRRESYVDILARAGRAEIEGKGQGSRNPSYADSHAMFSHGAVFAEVKVDPDLLQIRCTRLIGAFAAGRIINPHLTRSQLTGGMIWGLGFALQEEALHDRRTGRIMNADLAGYHVPIQADVPNVEAFTVAEDDPYVNPLGVKGVGEIGTTGTAGAIANAVWHATGVRPRSYPIHIADLLV